MQKEKFSLKEIGQEKPAICVVGLLHGDEPVGRKVIDALEKQKITKGKLGLLLANLPAEKAGKRFLDQDLNRAFPGKKDGTKEERLAYEILQATKGYDFVIDIHSTSSDTKDVVIVKKLSPEIKKFLKFFSPKRVVLMPKGMGDGSLINHISGVSLEYGSHDSEQTFGKSLKTVQGILTGLEMIKGEVDTKGFAGTVFFEVKEIIKKPKNFIFSKDISNFKLVKKNKVLGFSDGNQILAEQDFYPVLYNEKAYNFICFVAEKIDIK